MQTNLRRFLFYFISFCCLLSSNLWSQNLYHKYDFISIKEGVSKVGIYNIIQDNLGFIWIGTNGAGLYRYDGINYDSYKYVINDSTSLSSSNVHSSYLDSKNRLWFGTGDGLNLYDCENDRFKRIPNSEFAIEDTTKIIVRCLKEDTEGNLFIGTIGSGLFKLNLNSFKIEKVISRESFESFPLNINALEIDKYGKIYVGTNTDIRGYDSKANSLKSLVPKNKINTGSIESLIIDIDNNIWAGSASNGLYKLSKSNTEESFKIDNYLITENKILSLANLPNGTLICGTENNGIFHLDYNGKILNNYLSSKIDKKSILSNSIWSLYVDYDERIWVGYYNTGVSVYDKLYDKFNDIESFYNNPNSLQHGSVSAIVKYKKNKLWIAMDGGGIDIVDKAANKFTHINPLSTKDYSGLTSNYIESLLIDSNQNLWAGSWDKGLYCLKKGAKSFINFNSDNTNGHLKTNTILSIAEDSEGIIWIGTFNRGLQSYNPKTKDFKQYNSGDFLKYSLENDGIQVVLIDSNDNIWLGTTRGVYKVERLGNNKFSIVSMTDKISKKFDNHVNSNNITSLYESKDNCIWIGTRGAGLYKYDPKSGTFSWYNKTNGLIEENVNNIIESLDGNIWVSGNSGITKFDSQNNAFINYTSHDGLLSNDYNVNSAFRDHQGNLYFGNFQGVDYFHPNKIDINKGLTSLYLKELKLFNESVHPNQKDSPLRKVISETDSISLNSKQSVFTIEYLGLNYTRPEEINYAYYLEGYEDSWNYVGKKRNATYTNLDAGDYTFMLKASNNDGVWNEKGLTLKITILPPWWKTNWAIFTYITLFFLGLYLLNKVTKARIKEKELINNERVKRLQKIDLHEKKFQFFTNISHEFRTPLTLIINPLKDIINDDKLNLPERINDKHKIIHKNADRLYRLINELLDFRKLELNKVKIKARELNLVNFSKDVISHFKEEAFTRNVDLSLDVDVSNLSVWADESMLEKIIFNLLSNALKVTPDDGSINVQLLSNDDEYKLPLMDEKKPVKVVQIIISDTGPGLEKQEVKKIFERFYQVENLNKTYFGGIGIGLEVVQNFVALHKGKIKVVSEVGKGTTFIIRLPQGNNHFGKDEIVSNYLEVQTQHEINTQIYATNQPESESENEENPISHTLLIVDDNTELRNYLKEELKNQYRILTAKNGKEGLNLAKESLPDIIITDVIMPEMDGYTFCKEIKTDIKTSHIPLLMLTAKARIENRMEGIEIGADAYMVKPFDMRLLKLRLSQLITSRQLIFDKYFRVINDIPDNIKTTSLDKEFIDKVLNYINANIGDPDLNVESLASQLNLSRSQFYRKIKALTNQTANEFLRNIRLQKAKQILEMGNNSISEVCYATGFSSPSYFSKCFKSYFGMLPTDIKQE